MSNDIATGTFYESLVKNKFAVSEAVVKRNQGGKYTGFVRMSDATITGTKKKKFGAIEDMYVHPDV